MYGKIFVNTIIIVSLAILQLSLVKALPGWLSFFNIIIITLVFTLSLADLREALVWGIGFGVIMDLYSFFPFGFFLFNYLIITISANVILTNFITNRSLYSLLTLSTYSLFIHVCLKYLFFIINNFFIGQKLLFGINEGFWKNELISIFVNLVLVAALFYVINLISLKFKPVLLVRKKINEV